MRESRFQTLQDKIRVHLPDQATELNTGELICLEAGIHHDVEALKESAFLITVSWPVVSAEERLIFTHVVVRVIKVRRHEGFTGLVYWEALKGQEIDGEASGIQEAQHFPADFHLVRVPAAIAA